MNESNQRVAADLLVAALQKQELVLKTDPSQAAKQVGDMYGLIYQAVLAAQRPR